MRIVTALKEIHLTPKSPSPQQFADTVGYLGGDLPSVVVHIHGRKFQIKAGQAIPVYGKSFMLENPYSRGGRVQIVFNGPVNTSVSAADLSQVEYVTYRNSYEIKNNPEKNSRGVAFLPQKNRYLIKWGGGNNLNVATINGVDPSFLGTKPAAFMPDTSEPLQHPTGDTLPDLLTIQGHYSPVDMSKTSA